jgi:phage minor structural protein
LCVFFLGGVKILLSVYDYDSNQKVILRSNRNQYIQGETYNITYRITDTGIKEMSMILPPYITVDSVQSENHRWDYISPEYKVKYVDDESKIDWFFIKTLNEIHDEKGNLESNIQLKHISFKLNKKGLDKIIDITDTPDNIMDTILQGTGWSRGTISASILAKTRTISIPNKTNTIEQLQELAEKVEGYLQYNGDKTIDLLENLGSDLGVQIRIGKNLKNIKRTSDSDVITRLYMYGGETTSGITTIADSNPTGESYIDNFSWYIDNGLMPAAKQALISTYNSDIITVNNNIATSQSTISENQSLMVAKQAQLNAKNIRINALTILISNLTDNYDSETDPTIKANLQAGINTYTNRKSYLQNGGNFSLTGTVEVLVGTPTVVTGTGTYFRAEDLLPYDTITISGETRTISQVLSNTSLVVSEAFTISGSGLSATGTIISITALQTQIDTHNTNITNATSDLNSYLSSKSSTMDTFSEAMSDFLHIGYITDSNYITSSALYADAITTLARLCQPQIDYDLSFVDLAKLLPDDYSLEKVHIGDTLYVYDELLGINTTITVTELSQQLDDTDNSDITV